MDDEERLEGEEEMELDEASDGEDDDEENSGIPISPANSDQLLGSAPTPSTSQCLSFHAESLNSNARDAYNITAEEVFHDPLRYQKFPLPGGKPLHIRRGPGRPRKERPPGIPRGSGMRRGFGRGLTRGKGFGYGRGMPRRTKSKDDDTHSESPSPLRIGDDVSIDGESSGLERSMPAPEEPPYFPEQWPGKVCALCNLSERSQLGQGELLKFSIPEDFTPEKNSNREETLESLVDAPVSGDKSPRASNSLGAVTCRRQKSLAKCRNPSLTNFTEPVEELTIVGYLEEPDLRIIFESTGHYYVHQACALWTSCNQEMSTEMISSAIVKASTRRCACCSHYGAGISCKVQSCNRYFHYPCAAASSCFQDVKSLSLFCSQHLGQVPLLLNGDGERIKCITCLGMGDVSNLVMCTVCGQHYHGNCVGLALLPSVRAGWQCTNCRLCQVCRQPEELAKVMTCERCDKAYHPSCLRPIVTSIPKYGWKCKCCRVCTDCGSRTPGAGLSSRWHSHYTVCDSCYQQRNKGFSCPLCRKAYRAAAYREMVQCSSCKKFVHGTCDPEADPLTYQHRKEAKPDYDYVCLHCKNVALVKRKDSVDDYGGESSLTASQESLYGDGDSSEFDYHGSSEDAFYSIGLGKGKPFCASKIAKKRLGLAGSLVGRPKGVGKLGYQKRQKMTEFGRKRGPKAKMRGIFGVPGLGLQRPISDSFSKEEEPGVENRLVLCSAKDKFVLSQDICVMCGAIGTDQEGCLIACAQCGQCYHPYCANVKVTKVILQKGWRCLDCTVCEGCGERNDEGRLILCDDCDISYHIYCMDPPLEYVPQGTWKCKWCAQCQTCGANDPGFNSNWQKNYTQCGPCASHNSCAACTEAYGEGELIIQCIQCERWLHCLCDGIKTETEAEKCAEEGYNCVLCRPRDIPPPHILCNLTKPQMSKYQQPRTPPPIIRSPEPEKPSLQQYLVEGVFLSEAGMCHIKSLMSEHQITRKKRRKLAAAAIIDTEADIMATIESVVAGGSLDNSLEDSGKLELLEAKDEPTQVYKEGMVWAPRGDLPPPEGFSIYTTENGVSVLRRKRQRNLQKLGIGGFVVRLRGTRKDKDDEIDIPGISDSLLSLGPADDKPRRKPQRRKPKTKLAECFPLYMQEAFFGRDLMDTTKDKDLDSSSDSSSERNNSGNADTIQLSRDELKAMELLKTKQEKDEEQPISEANIKREEIIKEEGSDTEALDDILPISSDLLDSDLVNTIMNEPDDDLAKATEAWDELDQAPESTKDELPDILSPHFNLESMVRDTGLSNMASQDVEEIFKGVLTDESQESRESSGYPVQAQTPQASTSSTPLVSPSPHPANIQPTNLPLGRPQVPATLPSVGQSNLNSPMSFPPPSPYHSEYSNSPFSPAFSEPPSPWVNPEDEGSASATGTAAITYNQRTSIKMEADEALGNGATTASVLYANMNHPEWKNDYPNWSERYKQIIKKWRALPGDKKAPYVSQARENRAAIRMKKVQQIPKELANTKPTTSTSAVGILTKGAVSVPPVVVMTTSQQPLSEPKDKQAPADKAMPSNPAAVVATAVAAAQAAAHAASASATAPQLAEEQDKLANRDRSSREAEQERQWKQLQAIRQHQAQMQQQVIHDQRAHAIARVHRQLTEDSTPTLSNENTTTMTTQLVSAPQDGTSLGQLGSGSQTQPTSRGQFAAPALKVNRGIAPPSPHPGMPGRLIGQQQQQQPATAQVGRPLPVVARAGLPVSFGQQQPPSPFSPQAPQSPHDFPQSPVPQPQPEHFQRFESAEGFGQASQNQSRSTPSYSTSPRSDGFPQPPGTPRPIFSAPAGRPTSHVYAPSRTPESYTTPQQQQQQTQPPPPPSPATPSPVSNYLSPRPEQRVDPQPAELFTQQPEVNRQLRDLLQRQQQFSKEMKPLNQAWTQDGQTATEASQQQFDSSLVQQHSQQSSNSPGEGTFRQPLPPGAARPRMPVQPNVLIRNPIGLTPRHPAVTNIDSAKLQGIDTRNRMLLQRPPVPTNVAQQFQNNQIIQQRIAGPRTQLQEHYEVLQQRFPDTNQGQNLGQRIVRTGQNTVNQGVRMISTTGMVRPPILPTVSEANVTMSETSEIPDNVTAELEKLEQEGAPMVEVENVSAILGDLADDDDELLAEMGADFNILEYADPELDQLTGGEKTNILDLDLEQDEVETKEEKQKKDIKEEEHKSKSLGTSSVADSSEVNATTMQTSTVTSNVLTQAQTMAPISQATQSAHPQAAMIPQPHPQAVVVQQQMHQHVQQAAAMGRPILPGTRLLSPDGAIGVVTSTNSVTVSYPSTFPAHPQRIPQQHLQVQQHQRMGIRVAGVTNVAGRVVSVGHMIGPRMPLAPPPPPPPYPGPPPPYPGPNQSCSQEQPLLLEELLEQEKREQEKQQQQQQQADTTTPNSALLSDIEFERLRADVLGSAPLSSPPQRITTPSPGVNTIRPACPPRPTVAATQNWQQPVTDPGKVVVQTQRQPISTQTATEPRIATFNIPQLPAPPVPPDNIVTEQERHVQLQYEQWLNHQHQILTQQLKYYETEVQKLRKVRKSLNSKQRQCRKSGNELPENDAAELQRISSEQAIFQKHLDTSRKQSRQHGMLIQEYRNKQQQQQQKQAQAQPQPQPQPNEPCSPLMSPSQHSSPMHSPAALMSQSPGPGMPQHSPVASIVQHSPGTMSPHSNMQPSPRIGTPHSQSEESPFSPGLCGPTVQRMASPQHRAVATSRLTTSPGSFTSEQQQIRMPQQMHILPQRFVRPTTMGDSAQRPRMQMQGGMIYGQRSPLGSPQPNQQPMMTQQQHQQMLQRQQMIQQQHEVSVISQENQNIVNQRNLQMVQRQQSLQQQQQQQQQQIMQKPPTSPMVSQPASSPSPQLHQQIQQNFNQPPSSPHPRSPMVQQTMGSPMLQQQLSQSSQPSSPMNTRVQNHPPNSPMVVQYQPPSPMSRNHPSTSPMLHQMTGAHHPPTCQTPNSPMPRSPMVGGSPMQIQRRQSTGNSPAMPDRPQSVENPGTPRTPHTPHTPHSAYSSQNSSNHSMSDQQHLQNSQNLQLIQQSQQESNLTIDQNNRGGGNPHNSNNPIPLPVLFGRYGFFKLGLRGGSPMWSSKPESSKGKTAEGQLSSSEDKPNTSSAVHRKTGISQSKINSLVCADYNDFDDDSHTPPQTPPTTLEPKAATSSITNNTIITLDSPSDKVESLPDTTDYDDDKTIINTEVTLSSTAQKDNDDIPVIEQFGDSELDVISGSLESEMQEEYVLFESDMVLSVDSNDSLSNALVNDNNEGHDLVHILEIEHPEPPNEDASFDDELLSAQTNRNKKSLHLDIVRAMPVGKRLIAVTDTPESPDQDDLSVDPSPSLYMDHSPDQDLLVSLSESDIVIIDPTSKSPDSTSKICCDEDSSETNSIGTIKFKVEPITSTTDSAIVTKSLTPVTAEIKVPEETKEKKSFTSFTFQEKFSQIPPVSLHQTIGVHGITKSISTYSSISTKTTSSYNTITASIKPLIKSTISAPTTNIMKDLLTSSAMECQKQINIPLTISSIVADAKITAKLSQSTSKCISSGTIQIGRIVSKSEDAVTKHNSTTVLTSTIMCQPLLSLPEKATTVLSSTICCQPSINLTEKLTTVSSTLPSQILQSKVSTVPKSVEKMKSNSTQKFTAQSSSATLTSSKITTAELSKQEFLNAKSADKFDSITVGNEIKKTDEIMSEILKEEKAEKLIVDSSSNTVTLQKISVLDDKKTDILNTTDELESMLEAIHNPDDENAINGDKNLNKDKTDVRTLKRMSPVADDLSLVNILENDVETVTQNDSKEISNDNVQTRKINKADKVEEQHGVAEIKPNNSGNLTSEKASMQSIVETENESNKFFIQSRISEQKAIIEESSDDILDMLQNIISSKPEMQDDKSQKSNLIYQLEAPLEALPLNILQDSLADLEQEPTSGDSESLNIEKKSLPVVKSSTFNTQQTPALSKKNLSAQTSQTLTVSTVAQLQSTTTTVPHLSPLSQPTEIKSNTDNVSDQLRTLLSSLHSTSAQSYVSGMQANLEITAPVTTAGLVSLSNSSVIPTSYRLGVTSKSDTAPKEPGSTKTRSSGAISITSNAMLNAMLSSTSSLKSSVAGGLRASTILTSSSNLLNSIVSQSSVQRPPTSSVQTVLQVSTNSSSAATVAAATAVAVSSRVLVNVTTSQQQPRSSSVSTQSTSRGLAQPVLASIANAISVTTSILQSTLSQAPTLLHTQLTAGPSQYKSAGSLPIDNKSADADSASKCISAANKSSLGKKEAEGLLVKGLSCEKGSTSRTDLEVNKTNSSLHRIEDSQNVLLKQLLQNTACATTSGTSSSTQTASFPNVPSLEDQLARPVPPTPSSLIPPLLDEIPVTKSTSTKQILSRETSFLSHAIKSQSPSSVEEPTKLTPAITSPLLTTLTKPINENFEKQQTKGTSITSQVTQQHITSVAQKQTGPSAFPLTPIEKSVTHQETVSLQSQVKTSVETTISNVVQTQQQPTQRIPTTVSGARVQVEQQQQQQQPTPSPQQSQPQLQPQQPHAQTQSQQQQQQETIIAAKAANTNETRDVMPSPSPQQSNITVGSASHPKSVSPAIQRSPGAVANIIVSATGELTKSPQQINSVQPPVPQTASIAQTLGRQAQLPQGTIAQHTVPLTEVKKEILDDVLSSGTSVQLTDTKDFLTAKEELIDGPIDDKTDLKKLKRRQYQQKRRQSQGKDASMAPQKKRSRKVSRLDEDYDTYIDNLMVQLRQLQPMAVLEPLLGKNYGVCPIFGSGDLLKFGGPVEYNTRTGDLIGSYGNARITGISDHYNTQPFGELEPFPPLPPVSTQRSFYDQEFPPLKLDDSDDKKENSLMGRDIDTPDTIVSSSSPECVIPEYVHRFPGLKLIEEESDEEADWLRRISPVIPIVSPVPIRLKPGHLKDVAKQDKENVGITRLSKSSPTTLSENGNVTVTLTLNSQAADDIMGVLKDLANILNIAPPTGYQIIERTTTPPSQKLGLYRIKGKDGKEGAPIDIQSILNGAAKFCRHCDVVILNSLIRKKVSDLPFLSKEEAEPGDELCFCSVTCYMQFALMHRTPSNIHDKAAAIVDHLCQKSDSKLLEEDLKKIQGKRFSIKQSIGQIETMDVDSIEMDLECRIKTERDELDSQHSRESFSDEKRPKKHPASEEPSNDSIVPQPPPKIWRGLRYKTWIAGAIQPTTKYKKPTDREITEMLFRLGVTVSFPLSTDDTRRCMFCQNVGDGAADGTARLLNFDVDKWVHLNCALWSEDVYETVNGALMNLDIALQSAKGTTCLLCKQSGATVKCFKIRCNSHYHLGCAVRDGCIFYKNKSTYCSQHVPKNEKDNELTTLSVYRRVYVNRDENKQVAAVMHHSDHNNLLRVGSLIFLSVGQLLPHQLANFHTANHIYPVGYKIVRFYWSMRRPNKRCRYVCSIHDVSGRPEFRVLVQEPSQEDVELRDASPRAVWNRILEPLSELRRNINSVQLFPRYVTGEDLFGLTEPAVVRVLESLPGIETLTDYRFKYGRNPLLELPLAINPSGCARTEARLKNQLPWKRPHTQRTASSARASYAPASNSSGEVACPYSKQFVHSKSSQYKKMKQDWRNNVYLARSKIQGLGLYATRDLEKHTMVIEYIGEIIRTELAETREKQYEARNRGIYMFRLDEDRVVDATLCGGLARYINHSCNPNCVAEIVEVERDLRIIIFAKRRISRGEELAYDYKFDIEDDQHKIACACGAPNCRKWMN